MSALLQLLVCDHPGNDKHICNASGIKAQSAPDDRSLQIYPKCFPDWLSGNNPTDAVEARQIRQSMPGR